MDDYALSILDLFSNRSFLTLGQLAAVFNVDQSAVEEPVRYLRKNGYLKIDPDYALISDIDLEFGALLFDTPLKITYEGKVVLSNIKDEKKKLKYSEIRAWVTAGVAVAAFIKSFFFS